ncbi:MAG: small multi-drug export protein [Planctomycetota bacterium]|jgi:uncharacterized membrane protein
MEETSEQPSSEPSPQKPNQLKVTLLSSSEGRLLLVGVGLALAYTFWLGVKLLFSPDDSQVLVGMTATHVMFGLIIETIFVLIFYPLFVFSWRHLLVLNWLRNIFERIRAAAEARKGLVQRYGVIGLFVFVWIPFWMTGPVVGCVIGFLLGLRVWVNISVVLAGTYVAIFGWAFLLRQLHDRVASYSSYAAMVLMILLVAIIIVGHLLHRGFHNTRRKN